MVRKTHEEIQLPPLIIRIIVDVEQGASPGHCPFERRRMHRIPPQSGWCFVWAIIKQYSVGSVPERKRLPDFFQGLDCDKIMDGPIFAMCDSSGQVVFFVLVAD